MALKESDDFSKEGLYDIVILDAFGGGDLSIPKPLRGPEFSGLVAKLLHPMHGSLLVNTIPPYSKTSEIADIFKATMLNQELPRSDRGLLPLFGLGNRSGNIHKKFLREEGFISDGADILVEKMTIAAAQEKCLSLPGCKGFTFEGLPTDETKQIIFKGKWDCQGEGWTSYRLVTDGSSKDGVEPGGSSFSVGMKTEDNEVVAIVRGLPAFKRGQDARNALCQAAVPVADEMGFQFSTESCLRSEYKLV